MYVKANLNATLGSCFKYMYPPQNNDIELLVIASANAHQFWKCRHICIYRLQTFSGLYRLQLNFQKFCRSPSNFRTFQGSGKSNAEFEIFCSTSGNSI